MPSDCTIRYAVLDDVTTLVDLAATTLRETYSSNHDLDQIEQHIASNLSEPQIAAEVDSPTKRTLLACVEGKPVGYATLRIVSAPSCVAAKSPIELARLYLRRSEVGKGRGSDLMQACLDEGGKLERDVIWLSVWDQNEQALLFYAKWGFERAGTHAFVFGGKTYEDLVMARPIASRTPDRQRGLVLNDSMIRGRTSTDL
jgi:diamine N-acetyltransferase